MRHKLSLCPLVLPAFIKMLFEVFRNFNILFEGNRGMSVCPLNPLIQITESDEVCCKHSLFNCFFPRQLRQPQPAHTIMLSFDSHRPNYSSPSAILQVWLRKREKITMSAVLIKTNTTVDNMSCGVKTLLREHAKWCESYLIRYYERLNGWGHVQSQDTLLCLNDRQFDLLQSIM